MCTLYRDQKCASRGHRERIIHIEFTFFVRQTLMLLSIKRNTKIEFIANAYKSNTQ